MAEIIGTIIAFDHNPFIDHIKKDVFRKKDSFFKSKVKKNEMHDSHKLKT